MTRNAIQRLAMVFCLVLMTAMAMAGELTLKSPTSGQFLGLNNSIQFLVTGARVQVRVTASVTGPAGTTRISQDFTPDGDGKIDQSIAVNFNEGAPSGTYTIVLSATEPNNTYNEETVQVQVDVLRPKFIRFSPSANSFTRGLVRIRADLKETNLKDWRVKVNGQDIPNNTGTTNTVSVDWDATLNERDGNNTIEITVRDQANNEASQQIPVVLDRVKPSASITFPRATTRLVPNTNFNVSIDVTDASTSSVDVTGIDVTIRRLDGTYITRVARISASPEGGNTLRWIGRVRYVRGLLPSQFKLVVTVVDRAGNVAVPQEVTLNGR